MSLKFYFPDKIVAQDSDEEIPKIIDKLLIGPILHANRPIKSQEIVIDGSYPSFVHFFMQFGAQSPLCAPIGLHIRVIGP